MPSCTRCHQYPCRCTGNVDVIAAHFGQRQPVPRCAVRSPGSICTPCTKEVGHAGDHGDGLATWPQAPDAAQAMSPEYRQGKAHMTAIPFGGRWPEVPVSPIEPGLKKFDVRYSVAIEATDKEAAIRLANAIAEFMMGDCNAHEGESVAVVQACAHSVGLSE